MQNKTTKSTTKTWPAKQQTNNEQQTQHKQIQIQMQAGRQAVAAIRTTVKMVEKWKDFLFSRLTFPEFPYSTYRVHKQQTHL